MERDSRSAPPTRCSTGPKSRATADADADALIEYRHESIGGRLEPDGAFAGTRWRSVAVASVDEDEPQFQSTSAPPSTAEVTGLKALVEDMLRRRPPVVEEGDR